MFQVDKGSLENNFEDPFTAVHSFTFLDWKLITELGNKKVKITDIDLQQMQRLSLNILPEGISILHVLIKQTEIF